MLVGLVRGSPSAPWPRRKKDESRRSALAEVRLSLITERRTPPLCCEDERKGEHSPGGLNGKGRYLRRKESLRRWETGGRDDLLHRQDNEGS